MPHCRTSLNLYVLRHCTAQMDGAGADGNATPRFAAYGATKRSLAQLGKSLTAELGLLVS